LIEAILFGLAAAAAWGGSDLVTAMIGRRFSPFLVLVTAHCAATVLMTLLLLFVLDVDTPSTGQAALALSLGIISVATYLTLYRALALGPLTIVSPVISSWVVVTVLLAVVVLAEPLGVVPAIACAVIVVGVVLGSRGRAAPAGRPSAGRAGLLFALAAMAGLGVLNLVLGRLAQDIGWFLPLYLSRGASAAILLTIAAARRDLPWRRLNRRTLLTAIAVPGTIATLGGFAFNAGAETNISITAAASSVYPLIPVAAGVLLLRERLAAHQVVGLGAIIGGLVVLGLAT
jgi:drug/metabolite transporter (DMT)-like permease